ncbi:MAG: PAS-domain containing protein [Rhodocyclaceae bacterium]|nr:PAS-domain containing protein [Rhodocyclaceae bacterium]
MKTENCRDCMEVRQLELIQRIGRIGYWEYDPKVNSISLTEASLSLLGDILGADCKSSRDFMQALSNDERKRFQSALDLAISKSLPLNIELRLTSNGSKTCFVVARGAPIELGNGLTGFVGTFQDITSEKSRQADHEKLNTQLQALLDALPQGVSVVDKDLRLILWNRNFHEILGFPQSMVFRNARFEDLIQFNAARGEYGPGNLEDQVQAIVARAKEFLPHRFERQLTGGRSLLVEGFPFKSGGEISGFVTTYTDITEQKHTEQQIMRQHDVMKTIIDNFPGGISLCDTDLRFTTYNDQFIKLLDFPETLFDKGWAHFEELARFNVSRGEYGPGDPEKQVQAVVERAKNFQAHQIERARPNGRWLEIRGTPIPSGGFVTSYIDITERKMIEAELVHSKEVAETRREKVASLLDNSGEGFLSFGADLIIEAECSNACQSMLGASPAGKNAADVFFQDDAGKIDLFCSTISSVLAETDHFIRECMLSLLPTEIQRDEALLKAEYKILDNGKFMVVLTDITAAQQMAARLESEQHRLELIVKAVSDRRNFFDAVNGFRDFLAQDLQRILQGSSSPKSITQELYREVHTYKGLLNQFSFPHTPDVLHSLETDLSGALELGEQLKMQRIIDLGASEVLEAAFDKDIAILSDALGEEFLLQGENFILSERQVLELESLAARLLNGEIIDSSAPEIRHLLEEISTLHKMLLRDVLSGFDGLVSQTAQRLEKDVAPIIIEGGADVWIDPKVYRPFFRSLVHVFRNAVTHGIESPETRWEAGKEEKGMITCKIEIEAGNIKLSIADNGSGINLDSLRQRVVSAGIYNANDILTIHEDELAQLIFMDSITTQKEVSALAGRGVGLAAVFCEIINIGGSAKVKTSTGQGTEFLFTFPLAQKL